MQTLQASANPDMARQVLDQALGDLQPGASGKDLPTVVAPSDLVIELPFGYPDPSSGVVHREAEVRELNGNDEEALARIPAGNTGRLLSTILERGVLRVGTLPATADLLDSLLIADRDLLLMAVRRATYGEHVDIVVNCPECKDVTERSISLDDIPVDLPADRTERFLTLPLRAGEAVLALPTGKVHREISAAGDRTSAELNTVLIAGCLRSLNGISLMGPSQARGLSMRDRRTVLSALLDRMWGPQLGNIPTSCATCGKEIPLSLSMGDLFRL